MGIVGFCWGGRATWLYADHNPKVNHGFNADYRPTYGKTAATYAWKLTRDWLREHGV